MPETELSTGKFKVQRLPSLSEVVAAPIARVEERPAPARCANCDQPLAGPYCSRCGQHVADFHRSVWRFVVEFLDNTICWDNKLLRTLEPLFKQPGFLTREFMRGRRVRYVHPLRLFLFTSAVCLALLQYGHNNLLLIGSDRKDHHGKQGVNFQIGDKSSPPPAVAPASAASPAPAAPVFPPAGSQPANEKDATGEDADPAGQAVKSAIAGKLAAVGKSLGDPAHLPSTDSDDTLDQAIEAKIHAAGGMEKFGRAITDGVEHRLSWVALALLPVFALGLRSLYWRNDSFYFEHLIFSLHYHTFLFLFWTMYVAAQTMVGWLPFHGFLELIVKLGLLGPPIYLYLALRLMYGDGPKRTATKVCVLGSMHLLAIVIGVGAVGAMAFFSAK